MPMLLQWRRLSPGHYLCREGVIIRNKSGGWDIYWFCKLAEPFHVRSLKEAQALMESAETDWQRHKYLQETGFLPGL